MRNYITAALILAAILTAECIPLAVGFTAAALVTSYAASCSG